MSWLERACEPPARPREPKPTVGWDYFEKHFETGCNHSKIPLIPVGIETVPVLRKMRERLVDFLDPRGFGASLLWLELPNPFFAARFRYVMNRLDIVVVSTSIIAKDLHQDSDMNQPSLKECPPGNNILRYRTNAPEALRGFHEHPNLVIQMLSVAS